MSLPQVIEDAMENAIVLLAQSLSCDYFEAETHCSLIVFGWNNSEETKRAVAHYLVGLRACAIDSALKIKSQLEDTPEDRLEIERNVLNIIGNNNGNLSEDQKQDERNPWLSEGLWHLCMAIAARRYEFHPIGRIISIDYAHVATKDHGLDVLVLYQSEELLGLSIVETKAYKDDPNRAINNAVDFYREIDNGKHDLRIRQSVQIMRTALNPDLQRKISGSFWKRNRSYIPNPHYDDHIQMDWQNTRPSFRNLFPDRNKIMLMPHMIHEFDSFFDEISNEMRIFVRSL